MLQMLVSRVDIFIIRTPMMASKGAAGSRTSPFILRSPAISKDRGTEMTVKEEIKNVYRISGCVTEFVTLIAQQVPRHLCVFRLGLKIEK